MHCVAGKKYKKDNDQHWLQSLRKICTYKWDGNWTLLEIKFISIGKGNPVNVVTEH